MSKSKEMVSTSSSEEEDEVPKPKKKKVEDKKKAEPKAATSKAKKGETKFELGKMRYVTVSDFKGRKMVDIREFYDKDGDLKPGKKGIAMSVEQWEKLKSFTDEIDSALADL